MKFKRGDKVKVKNAGNVYVVSNINDPDSPHPRYHLSTLILDANMGWYNEEDLASVTDPDKAAEESDNSAFDEPYTLPWEHEYPRNDCNATGGYGAVVKGEKHETSDYERGYKQGYEARKNEESKSAQMIVDYDKDLYEMGLNEAWKIANKIMQIPIQERAELFGISQNKACFTDISSRFSASEAADKLNAWEEKIIEGGKMGNIYERGLENIKKAEYERGLNEAWELVKRLRTTAPTDIIEIFDKDTTFSVIEELSASEAIEKWKAWEEKNEFKVGDEIIYRDGIKGVVVGISKYNEEISVLSNEYDVPQLLIKSHATKTGRHFDDIAEVLKKMKEEE